MSGHAKQADLRWPGPPSLSTESVVPCPTLSANPSTIQSPRHGQLSLKFPLPQHSSKPHSGRQEAPWGAASTHGSTLSLSLGTL